MGDIPSNHITPHVTKLHKHVNIPGVASVNLATRCAEPPSAPASPAPASVWPGHSNQFWIRKWFESGMCGRQALRSLNVINGFLDPQNLIPFSTCSSNFFQLCHTPSFWDQPSARMDSFFCTGRAVICWVVRICQGLSGSQSMLPFLAYSDAATSHCTVKPRISIHINLIKAPLPVDDTTFSYELDIG